MTRAIRELDGGRSRTGKFATLELEAADSPGCGKLDGRLMIDNQISAMELLAQIEKALPMPARLTRELRASLTNQNPATLVPADCTVTGFHYMGDEGGIVCKLDLGAGVKNEAFVSITHLRFDPRMPLGRKINAYQKHRVKRLRRQVP